MLINLSSFMFYFYNTFEQVFYLKDAWCIINLGIIINIITIIMSVIIIIIIFKGYINGQ